MKHDRIVKAVGRGTTAALFVAACAATPAFASGDSVYSSGLMELGGGAKAGMVGEADIAGDRKQPGPDWADLFDDAGYLLDYSAYGGTGSAFVADDVSLGTDFEGSALTVDGKIVNGVVQAANDIGYAYAYSTEDSAGNLVLYAATERLGDGDSTFDFEFNQDHFILGKGGYGVGEPWEVLGSRSVGDLLVRLTFAGGMLGSVEASVWDGETGWSPLSSLQDGEGCDTGEALCAAANAAWIHGGPWEASNVKISDNRFIEFGVNVGALLGADPLYTTVRMRTPEDAAFGYLGEGN